MMWGIDIFDTHSKA